MPDPPEVADDLYAYAGGIARNILNQHGLISDKHRLEDITQTLFLDGWEVWRDKGEVGLAKHRMQDRRKNEIKKLHPKKTFNRPVGQISEYAIERGTTVRNALQSPISRSIPLSEQLVEEFLKQLPERRRRIARLRMADYKNKAIAEETGVPLGTVENEITALRKALTKWRQTLCD